MNSLCHKIFLTIIGFAQCAFIARANAQRLEPADDSQPYVVVLGIAQDGGYPQAGCHRPCCERVRLDPTQQRFVVSLAIVDPSSQQRWLIECTPDFKQQLALLDEWAPPDQGLGIDGIFLTHAHIGHYAGLVHLGREAIGADAIPTYAMPRMREFLTNNGPWSLLVESRHIELRQLAADQSVQLNERLSITPLLVPHRDEFSETVGFRIEGPQRRVLFLPDIDKWERWERLIEDQVADVDVAFLDATFYSPDELPGRDISQIPHPVVSETIARFADRPLEHRQRIQLIHLNHTNPLLDSRSPEFGQLNRSGIGVAQQGSRVGL